jgi:type IV secretion system protein TrbL
MSGIASAARGALSQRMSGGVGLLAAAAEGQRAAWNAGTTGGQAGPGNTAAPTSDAVPGWARDLQNTQSRRHHRQAAIHALQGSDRGGSGATPDIKEKD